MLENKALAQSLTGLLRPWGDSAAYLNFLISFLVPWPFFRESVISWLIKKWASLTEFVVLVMWRCPLRAPSPVGNSGSRVGNGVETQGPRIVGTQGGSPSLFPGWWQVRAHPEKVTFKVDLGESTRGRGTDLGGKGRIVKQRNLYLPPWAFEGSKVGEITRNYWKCFGNVLILNFFWREREATGFLLSVVPSLAWNSSVIKDQEEIQLVSSSLHSPHCSLSVLCSKYSLEP